jgi:hypothetical protein
MASDGDASPPRKHMLLELPCDEEGVNVSQNVGVSASSATPAATRASHEQGQNPEGGSNVDGDDSSKEKHTSTNKFKACGTLNFSLAVSVIKRQ